jgi:2-haloacid dehalogenase
MDKYELIFLDADETLFDFQKAEKFALEKSFERFSLESTEASLRENDRINKALWLQLEKGEMSQEEL